MSSYMLSIDMHIYISYCACAYSSQFQLFYNVTRCVIIATDAHTLAGTMLKQ